MDERADVLRVSPTLSSKHPTQPSSDGCFLLPASPFPSSSGAVVLTCNLVGDRDRMYMMQVGRLGQLPWEWARRRRKRPGWRMRFPVSFQDTVVPGLLKFASPCAADTRSVSIPAASPDV